MAFLATSSHAQTVIIGDSIFALTKRVPKHLKENGVDFDLRAQTGAKLERIVEQYREYKSAHGVPKMVIMDGGGNNILRGHLENCRKRNKKCNDEIGNTLKILYEFWGELSEEGVESIVHVGLHYLSDKYRIYDPLIDEIMDEVKTICSFVPTDCKFVDPRPAFRGRENDLLIFDGIHPNKKGSIIIADLILEAL
jgi:lysophospholipase L1-like esterase